jgi:hypothetical protein
LEAVSSPSPEAAAAAAAAKDRKTCEILLKMAACNLGEEMRVTSHQQHRKDLSGNIVDSSKDMFWADVDKCTKA